MSSESILADRLAISERELQRYKVAYELATADLFVFCGKAAGAGLWYRWDSLQALREAGLSQAASIIAWQNGEAAAGGDE